MKKGLKIIKRVIYGILLVIYFGIAILISTLVLNRNDYGVTQFDDKVFILVDKTLANDNYKENSLVIVKQTPIKDLKPGEEIFVYQKNDDNTVKIVVSQIENITEDDKGTSFINLVNNGGAWGEKFIAGKTDTVYENIGGFLLFIESKWTFFIFLIIPGFFILLYEVYLIIITLKYGDDEDEELVKKIEPEIIEVKAEKPPVKEEPSIPVYESPKAPVLDDPFKTEPVPEFNNFSLYTDESVSDEPVEEYGSAPVFDIPLEEPNETSRKQVILPPPVVRNVQTVERANVPLGELANNIPNNMAVERTTYVKEEVRPVMPEVPKIPEPPRNEEYPSRVNREEVKKDSAAVEARLEELLKEVSKLRDELNTK